MDEMTNLRIQEYGSLAYKFLDAIDNTLIRKGWNTESIASCYVKGGVTALLFKELPVQDQRHLFRIFYKELSKKSVSSNQQSLKLTTKDDYQTKLWENGFGPQNTQGHLF